MNFYHKLPHDAEMVQLFEKGYTPASIAAAFHCSTHAVRKRFQRLGLRYDAPRPPRRKAPAPKADFLPPPVTLYRTAVTQGGNLYQVRMTLPRISMHVKALEARNG